MADLDALLLYNAGACLAEKGSFVAVELQLLHEHGVDILACGTCVDHFGPRDRMLFDEVSDMDAILTVIQEAEKVVTL